MYICLGNGGDATGTDQSGVLVLGDDGSVAVTGASAALQEVVTIKMADMSDPALAAALFPPTMWIQLTGLRIVGGGVGTSTIAMTPSSADTRRPVRSAAQPSASVGSTMSKG